MRHRLDPESPVPLYHQIAEAIRWSVSTGQLAAGERLPAVREAAEIFGVNRHTVRRAYGELAREGMVEILGARGTRVAESAAPREPARDENGPETAAGFLGRVVAEARTRFGWGPEELRSGLEAFPAAGARAVVHAVECSDSQSRDHAAEIAVRWDVDARPWNLSTAEEPPAGILVATFFHYAEIRRRWPHRWEDVHFVPIRPDATLPERLAGAVRAAGGRLVACEYDEAKALNLKADLALLFPAGRFTIVPRVVERAAEALSPDDPGAPPVCYAPRVWDALSPAEASHPRAVKVLYVIEPDALDDLGRSLAWRPAG